MTITNKKENCKTLGIYVHIPFCLKKCGYCDFLSFENKAVPAHKEYVKALLNEVESYGAEYSNNYLVDSVFIGGGTPSLISPDMIGDIIGAIKYNFNFDGDTEITIEANPGTLTGEKLDAYLAAGINRLSIGAQSFDDCILKILGRVHLAGDIYKNYRLAREAGFENINLDLIFGIPGQHIDIWKETLSGAIGLDPGHISFYSLQIEEGTRFYEMFEAGMYEKLSDELDREMYHYAVRELSDAGYTHYEISNAAKDGHECRHNIKYWSFKDYLGTGLGAHSYMDGVRFGNTKDPEKYIKLNLEGNDEPHGNEKLHEWRHENSFNDDVSEYMFTGLRMTKGIDLNDFENRFGKTLADTYKKEWAAVRRYIGDGLLIIDGRSLRLSEKGIDISNRIMSEFVISN